MTAAPPSLPPAPPAAPGLSTAAEIEAFADQLGAIADAIHKRVVKSIDDHKGKPIPQPEQAAARALIDHEMLLRQHANRLYAEAATLVVDSLGKSQAHVLALTAAAAEKIRKINRIGQITGLVSSLVGLAAAAATAQPVAILAAIEKVRAGIKGVRALDLPAAT